MVVEFGLATREGGMRFRVAVESRVLCYELGEVDTPRHAPGGEGKASIKGLKSD